MKISKSTALKAIAGFASKPYLTNAEKVAIMAHAAKVAS